VTVRVVDQQQVAPADLEEFVTLVHEQVVPTMEAAGAVLVGCDVAPRLGDDVDVLTTWSCHGFAEWNVIRRELMFDGRYHEYAAPLARLRRGGTRRFYSDAAHVAPHDDHGPAIRRWEMFSIASDAPQAARDRLWRAMHECDRYIPGITRCAVGTNQADGPIELVWETMYESVGAYRTTYMTHPYHAALLDRFLLPDSPERITTANSVGAGLVGYVVERDRRLGPVEIRRLLLLDFADPDTARAKAVEVDATGDGWGDSILAENTMSTRWFDGETDLGIPTPWSHVWDQCFASIEQYEAHQRGESRAAELEAGLGATRRLEIVYTPGIGNC
jgi:hypothetical protein